MVKQFSGASIKTGSTQQKARGNQVTAVEGKPIQEQKQQQPAESVNTGEQDVATFPNLG